jgi:flagella basal body P-ring formation protein FlgA
MLRLTVTLWLILLPVAALSATGDFSADVEKQVRDRFLDDRYEYEVTIPQTLAIPEQGYDKLQVEPLPNATPRGNFPVKVTFFKDGLALRNVNLALRIDVYRNVLVARERINRSEALTPDMFTLARREVSQLHYDPVVSTEELRDMCAARTIKEGQGLLEPMLTKLELVKRGDMVQIQYNRHGIKLTAAGEAKQAGGRGDLIKVKNLTSNITIIAEVKDDQTVEVLQ